MSKKQRRNFDAIIINASLKTVKLHLKKRVPKHIRAIKTNGHFMLNRPNVQLVIETAPIQSSVEDMFFAFDKNAPNSY